MDGVKALSLLVLFQLALCSGVQSVGISVNPPEVQKNVSDYVTVKCSIDLELSDIQQVYWTRQDGRALPERRHFVYPPYPLKQSYLLLYRLAAEDSGVYTCHAVTANSGIMQASANVRVVAQTTDTTPCMARPCRNGGTCLDIKTPTISTYVCMCRAEYTGRTCAALVLREDTLPPVTSPATTTPPRPTTTTPPPVTTVDPCASSPCRNGGRCSQSGDAYRCECTGSYTGRDCSVYDNCKVRPCVNGGVCTNLANHSGSCGGNSLLFSCRCSDGFTGTTCAKRDFCSSSPCRNGATCVNVDDRNYDCVCMDGYVGNQCETMPQTGCGKYGQHMQPRELRDFFHTETVRSSPPAADIVFVVDESGSMVTEHAWLERVSSALDSALQTSQIGSQVPNQFGLVGFARDNDMDVTGRIIHMDNGCQFGQASHFQRATSRLALNGRLEDMYLGIIMALDHYSFRPGMACQIIGVTDEGRYPLNPSSNHRDASAVPYEYEYMLQRLNETRCVLNVVVNQQMESAGKRGLGVGSNGEGYREADGGNFRVDPGQGRVVPDTGHGTTDKYYTKLALATHGGSWDLNKLRQGGETAMSFTKAFVHLKQREISRQLCERCSCDLGPVPFCRAGCLGEPPVDVVVESLYSRLSEPAVNEGGSALFDCQAGGDPAPTCSWTRPDGTALPSSARYLGEHNCTLMVPAVAGITCVQCMAGNIEGTMESTVQCLDYAAQCEMSDGRKVFHGSSARDYSETKLEDLRTIPFSSALVVLIVDESRSMIGEHRWLTSTMPALEKNLHARGVGTQGRGNQYALVGFASPRVGRLGRVIEVSPGQHCGTAHQVSTAMQNLRQDGRKEDGYAAIGMALDNISCLQGRRSNATALQVILVTDEDRDVLKREWDYERVRQAIVRRGGILNVVVKQQFEGKDENMRTVRAMGIDRRQRAVIVERNMEGFYFLPHGKPTRDTGHGTTELDYVNLATHTGGGAWDLTMLRDDSYREAFTKGFIAAKVEEIQVQLLSRCEECFCQNGTLQCNVLSSVKTEEGCLNPVANAELTVTILGESSAAAGDFSKLQCKVESVGANGEVLPLADEGQPAVVWDPHPVTGLQVNQQTDNRRQGDLEFAVASVEDARAYRCVGRNEYGEASAVVEYNVAQSASNPFQGVLFGGASGTSGAAARTTVLENQGASGICVHTNNVAPNGKMRKFSMRGDAGRETIEVHCMAETSAVEFGFTTSTEGEPLEFGVLHEGTTLEGSVLSFTPSELEGRSSFKVGCRPRGSAVENDCLHHNKCVRVTVRGSTLKVSPRNNVCQRSLVGTLA